MRLTLNQLRTEAEKIGATVDESTLRSGFVNVDAPVGKVWACSGDIHALCVWLNKPDHSSLLGDRPDAKFRRESIKDALERMSWGLIGCPILGCDVCEEKENLANARLDTLPPL